jgi:hypothetical protein
MGRLTDSIAPWTAARRRILALLVSLLLITLIVRQFTHPLHVDDPQPPEGPRFRDLADRIDPNTADAHTLAALPTIGPRRAADIIAYREQFQQRHPDRRAFESLEDLLKIRGIGYATTRHLEPYLIFRPPTTTPTPTPP